MPKCSKCGAENVEGTPICRECGATLSQESGLESSTDVASDSSVDDARVIELVQAGKKIEAIKVYREIHGVGLAEAKDAVETLAAEHGIAAQGSGCAGVVLLAALGVVAGA